MYWLLGEPDSLVLERSLYDVCFCDGFRGDDCAGTATLRTAAVSQTTLGAGAGWCATTVDFRVNPDGNVG